MKKSNQNEMKAKTLTDHTSLTYEYQIKYAALTNTTNHHLCVFIGSSLETI